MKLQATESIAMAEPDLSKSTTRQILIYEPDEDQLTKYLAGRDISPELGKFLSRLMKGKKWPRKINIPSSHDDLAAALVFSSELKPGGLEIISELHVFLQGVTMVEKWPIVGEGDRISSMPKENFSAVEIEKVRLEDALLVQVTLKMPSPSGTKTIVRSFDFSGTEPYVREVAHPLLGE